MIVNKQDHLPRFSKQRHETNHDKPLATSSIRKKLNNSEKWNIFKTRGGKIEIRINLIKNNYKSYPIAETTAASRQSIQ
jgi:hypothetical protein